MRSDLNKLLCERERPGSRNKFKNFRNLKSFKIDENGDNQPAQEGMKHRYGYDRKPFNENLNPLYGIIRKAVGRPWDKFYSELCETFNMRSVINNHILEHLYDYVNAKGVFVGDDGKLWVRDRWSRTEPLANSRFEFYVDPRDGIIKKNKHYKTYRQRNKEAAKAAQAKRDADKVLLDDGSVLQLIEGVWYHFELKDIPEGKTVFEKPAGDVFKNMYGKEVSWDMLGEYDRIRYGIRRFKGESVKDLISGETLYRDGGVTRVLYGFGRSADRLSTVTKYHATKKTASHKTLKKAGLV